MSIVRSLPRAAGRRAWSSGASREPDCILSLDPHDRCAIAWFVSDFSVPRRLRRVVGLLAVLLSFELAFVLGSLERLNSKAWFGGAIKDLIDTTVTELAAGCDKSAMRALKVLQPKYQPTRENRAQCDELVCKAVAQMKQVSATRPAP